MPENPVGWTGVGGCYLRDRKILTLSSFLWQPAGLERYYLCPFIMWLFCQANFIDLSVHTWKYAYVLVCVHVYIHPLWMFDVNLFHVCVHMCTRENLCADLFLYVTSHMCNVRLYLCLCSGEMFSRHLCMSPWFNTSPCNCLHVQWASEYTCMCECECRCVLGERVHLAIFCVHWTVHG